MKELLKSMKEALAAGHFVKLSLGGYRGADPELKKITARPVIIKREEKLSFTYTYKTRDIVKNYSFEESLRKIGEYLQNGFTAATLFTTGYDLSYPSMKKSKPTIAQPPAKEHDRAKNRHVETKGKAYLQALKITDAKGEVFKNAHDKYKQIDKYVEILSGLLQDMPKEKIRHIVDMGAGKGYLTFALYDYLTGTMGLNPAVTGVEYRADLVDLCNKVSAESGFDNLKFVQGTVENYNAQDTDILIALHACDTATDDAIAKGIAAQTELIVVAPCCHKQIRNEMEKGKGARDLDFLLKYGTFLERQAEMVTDGLRAMILEYFGYSTKVFEFISDAHTPKNVMIVARRNEKAPQKPAVLLQKIADTKNYFGIKRHHLEEKTGI